MPANDDESVHVALTDEGCDCPRPLYVEWRWQLVSCLHALGAAFACQSIADTELNALIEALENERNQFPFDSAQALLGHLTKLDWRTFMDEVAEMHGPMARDGYRKTTLRIIEGLAEAVRREGPREIKYVRFGTGHSRNP